MNNDTQTNSNGTTSPKNQELGALWTKKSKAGATFLSGYVLDENQQRVNVVVFKNSYKKPGEKSPDYRVYLSEVKNPTAQTTSDPESTNVENSDSTEDIPF